MEEEVDTPPDATDVLSSISNATRVEDEGRKGEESGGRESNDDRGDDEEDCMEDRRRSK